MESHQHTDSGQRLAHHHHTHHVVRGGPVTLDIGDDIGALIAYLDPAEVGTEIHVRADHDTSRTTHTGVWERTIDGRPVVVAVFPELVEDDYGILAPDGAVLSRVSIRGGQIAEVDMRMERQATAR